MKNLIKKALSVILTLSVLGALLLSAGAVYTEAGENGSRGLPEGYPAPEVYVEHFGTIPYPEQIGNYYDYDYTVDGNRAYCLEPMRHGPETGTYDAGLLTASDNRELIRVLYYGYGGPGDLTEGYGDHNVRHILTHVACAMAYGDGNPFYGLTEEGIRLARNLYQECQAAEEPPEGACRLYILKADAGSQALGFVIYDLAKEGALELRKTSALPSLSGGNRCYSLEGAVYYLYRAGTEDVAAVLTTDSDGYARAEGIPEGSYEIREIQAPSGYLPDGSRYPVEITGDEVYTYSCQDQPAANPIRILLVKKDAETGETGGLAGAEYTVKYYDVISRGDPGAEGNEPLYTWVFRTDEEGVICFSEEYKVSGDPLTVSADGQPVLPVGTITIQETAAPEGYVLDPAVYTAWTAAEGGMAAVTENLPDTEETALKEQRIRGDLEFFKTDGDTQSPMAGIPFTITQEATGETHTVVTDGNGYYSTESSYVPHTQNTNAGTSDRDGVWFGPGDPDDSLGALPWGDYVLEEQPCQANEGKDLKVIRFTVSEHGQKIGLGTIRNDTVELRTCAADAATGTKTLAPEKDASVMDTVSYSNLTAGREYTLKGQIIVKETGEPLLSEGEPVTAEKVFSPEDGSGTVEMEFRFDASGLAGKTLVVFESLYWGEIPTAVHADPEDEGQTVRVPDIKTTAADGESGSHEGRAREDAVLTDTVAYRGLTPGETYRLTGVVMDRETGEPLQKNGEPVEVSETFVPESPEGTVEVRFVFDASGLEGRTVTVFETLYYGETQLAVHADIEDDGQSVYYPPIPRQPEEVPEQPPEVPATGDPGGMGTAGICLAGAAAAAAWLFKGRIRSGN